MTLPRFFTHTLCGAALLLACPLFLMNPSVSRADDAKPAAATGAAVDNNAGAAASDAAAEPAALPREGGDKKSQVAPEIETRLEGDSVPPFGDFHSRLGSRLAFNIKLDNGGGVETSTRGMPWSTRRAMLCGIEDAEGHWTLLPVCGKPASVGTTPSPSSTAPARHSPPGEVASTKSTASTASTASTSSTKPAAPVTLAAIRHQTMTLQSTTYETDSGFSVEIAAPFARTTKLDPGSFDLQCQIAPVFLVKIALSNDGAEAREGRFLCGFDRPLGRVGGDGWSGMAIRNWNGPPDAPPAADAAVASLGPAAPAPPAPDWPAPKHFDPAAAPSDTLALATIAPPGLSVVVNPPAFPGFGVVSVPFRVEPGQKIERTFFFSGYTNQPIQQDDRIKKPLYAYYCKLWPSHRALLDWAVKNQDALWNSVRRFDAAIPLDKVRPAQRLIAILGCRGYVEDTTLAWDGSDDPNGIYFSFMEAGFSGGYVNTLDLVPDVMAWDLNFHPWTLKNSLRRFKEYTYCDKYGLSVMHDMGGQDYEKEDKYRRDGGPWMMTEQAANYIHAVYGVWRFTDDAKWLEENREILRQLTDSLAARDGNGDGIQDLGSDRGHEGNTVDDGTIMGSNAQNHYMAIKQYIAYLAAAEAFAALKDDAYRAKAAGEAAKIAAALHKHIAAHGRFWPSDDVKAPIHDIHCVQLLKGLFTAFLAGMDLSGSAPFLADCRTHLDNTRKVNARFYGYPLTPHDPWLTWNSHTIMVDVVAEKFLGGLELQTAERMTNAFYYSGVANEFYNIHDPKVTNQWPAEQHYARMADALGWIPGMMLSDPPVNLK